MDIAVILVVVFAVFAVLLVIEVPIAWTLAVSGTVGIVLLRGVDIAGRSLAGVPYQSTASFLLTIVPMYVLLGTFAKHARIAEDVYRVGHRVLRRLPGGLGVATIAACAGFGAVSGSSVATVATIGRISIDEMRRYGYDVRLASGIVGSAGTLAILIPPSIVLVIYGSITGESIGRLLLAGLVPGLLSALAYMIYVSVRVHRATARVPAGDVPRAPSAADLAGSDGGRRGYAGVVKLLLLAVIVLGGIYAGVMTATESAAAGALVALLVLVGTHRANPRQVPRAVVASLREAAAVTGSIFAIFFGATLFTFFLVSAGIPSAVTGAVVALPMHPLLVVALILLVIIPLGMVLDGLSILLIVAPLAYPVVTELGFDGIWFGILLVKVIEIGLITPPVGINAYMVSGVVEGVPAETVFRGLLPFLGIDIVVTTLLFLVPALVTWLPSVAGV